MKKILIFIFSLLAGDALLTLLIFYGIVRIESDLFRLAMYCILFGLLGGIIHCMRSLYIHRALLNDWDDRWIIWYYLRPVVSALMGLISFIFIKAGLLIFTTQSAQTSTSRIAYMAIAFLAGYNVRNFLKKIEEVSEASLGIKMSEDVGG